MSCHVVMEEEFTKSENIYMGFFKFYFYFIDNFTSFRFMENLGYYQKFPDRAIW